MADGDGRSASTGRGQSFCRGSGCDQRAKRHGFSDCARRQNDHSGGHVDPAHRKQCDRKATASGAAVGVKTPKATRLIRPEVGIGAAVAVNVVKVKNTATLGVAVHSVGGLTIEALSLDVAKLMANSASTDTATDVFLASATSGAGGSKIGLAGSLALNLIDTQSIAQISSGATVAITGNNAVTITADNRTETTADANLSAAARPDRPSASAHRLH